LKNNLKKWFGVVKRTLKSIGNSKRTIVFVVGSFVCFQNTFAQETQSTDNYAGLQNPDQQSQKEEGATQKEGVTRSPISDIGNEFQNSIRFFNNRFRVDNDVAQVTMVFFREEGSSPIVLVRPDGSKVFIEDDEENDQLLWFETQTYDMISIQKPMPGPWQAVGDILEGSKVMVIADITLNAQAIPRNIYSGETIKQTVILENEGKQVDFSPFRDVVSISIDFVSNNNPNYENFGLGTRPIARFQDNGEGLDEAAADGVFTGQFNLDIPSGEWRPTFSIRTPMYNRERVNDTVMLHPNPISIDAKISEAEQGNHIITVDADAQHINMNSLVLDGKVTYPNGDIDNITMTETNDSIKVIKVINESYGIYRVKLTAFATTVDGREIILNVPEYSFLTFAPPPPEPPPIEAMASTPGLEPIVIPDNKVAANEWSAADILRTAISINLLILIFGGIGIFLVLNKRKYPDDHIMLQCKDFVLSVLEMLKSRISKITKKDASGDKVKT
jgi:uncharacterized protein (TIGR03503 family)